MASVLYSEDLICSVCLTLFTDPVTLLCGHSFCRRCITDVLSSQQQCPLCLTAVSAEVKSLPTSFILKSLTEKAKEAERVGKQRGDDPAEVAQWMCPEHEEKLKLFCVTDQQLACIICRDGERHEGHKFKPIREAAAAFRKESETFVQQVVDDASVLDSWAITQREEITRTTAKSEQLMTQISRQFEVMHQFLRKREDEIKKELKDKEKDELGKMREVLNALETALGESRELEGKVAEVLKITDSERFLKSWTDDEIMVAKKQSFSPRQNDLQVVNSSLSLGPYESHLQFFVWREMLQVVQPREELLSLKSNSPDLTVSDDGRNLFYKRKPESFPLGSSIDSKKYQSFSFSHAGGTSGFGLGGIRGSSVFGTKLSTGGSFGTSGFGTSQPTGGLFGTTSTFGAPAPVFSQSPPQTNSSSLSTSHAFSVSQFRSGQHYWETEVGIRDYWELGIKDHFLKYDGQKYATCDPNADTDLAFEDRPRKIGIYLNCSAKKLSFYSADNMTHIHTVSFDPVSMPVSAYFNIRFNTEPDCNPLTVCWY